MKIIKFEIEVTRQGTAKIVFPEGPGKQQDAALTGDLTEDLAKILGPIKERHKGKHHKVRRVQQGRVKGQR